MNSQHERWMAGDAYEQFMGRWSSEVAIQFLQWLNVAPQKRWLDVGCGTGALTRTIMHTTAPLMAVGLEPSVDFARYANSQTPQAHFLAANGSAIAFSDETFDAIVSGLVLNFIPQPERAVREMRRVVKRGGSVAAYIWDYASKMEFLRYFWDAALALDANAAHLHEGKRFPICAPDPLGQLWGEAGLKSVRVDALDIPTVFNNFESYWQPFTLGNFPAPKYAMSLDESQRTILRERLRTTLPTADDGSIHLIARAWAVCGYR